MKYLLLALLWIASAAFAQSTAPATRDADDLRTTWHELKTNAGALRYSATAGTLLMRDENDKPVARFFSVAYETGDKNRPVTFIFNGGPGAASAWLHLGTVGPQRIELDAAGLPTGPPHRLADNPHTWLRFTDLVFIDPVGTGYSRPAGERKADDFHGVQRDVESVGDFIRLWTTHNERWLSPKYLAGESYGTTRAALLAERLHDRFGLAVNGIILISTVLDFQTIQLGEGNDLPYCLYLPTYAQIALHHRRIKEVDAAQVERWAMSEYRAALAAGSSLSAEQRDVVVQRLAAYTGLEPRIILDADLRIAPGLFAKQLLRDRRLLVGRFDARVTGFEPRPLEPWPSYDPSLDPYFAAYSATINAYLRGPLQYRSDLVYEVLSPKLGKWDLRGDGEGYLYVADNLRSAMLKNPHLRVLVCGGRHDLATPYFAAEYTLRQLRVGDASLRNIRSILYDGGHMLYHHQPSHEKLAEDIERWMRE